MKFFTKYKIVSTVLKWFYLFLNYWSRKLFLPQNVFCSRYFLEKLEIQISNLKFESQIFQESIEMSSQ